MKNNQVITVYVSNGKAITIPNFINKSKTEANKLCNNLGLKCNFVYGSYSSLAKDTVTNQNKKASISVVSGVCLFVIVVTVPSALFPVIVYPSGTLSSAICRCSVL